MWNRSQFSKTYLIILTHALFLDVDLRVIGKENDNIFPIENLIKWIAMSCTMKVNTIRIVSENKHFVENILSSIAGWDMFSQITGLDVQQSHVKVSSVVVVHLTNIDIDYSNVFPSKSSSLVEWIEKYANKKWDHFLFVGTATQIGKVWEHKVLNTLKWKWGCSLPEPDHDSMLFTPIQQLDDPLQPTKFKNIKNFDNFFRPAMLGMGHNIRGRKFRCTGWAKASPYFFISKTHVNGESEFDGTMLRILRESSKRFNFTTEIYGNDEKTYAEYKNGTWTGIVGDLLDVHKQIDICIHLGPQIIWFDLFDFSNSMTSLKILFVTVQPVPEVQWEAFLHPFSITVWICLLLTCLLISTFMLINTKCLDIIGISGKERLLFRSIMTPYKLALEQSTKIIPGTRFLSGVWLLLIIVTGSAYRTQIISALTFPSETLLPKTNLELVARPDYKVILNNIGEVEIALFQTSESPAIQALAKRASYESSQFECIKSIILNPKTVCFSWCPMLLLVAAEKAIVDINVDPFVLSYDAVASSELSVGFKKNSPYYAGFSYIINAIYEGGFYKLWNTDIYNQQKRKGFALFKNSTGSLMHKKLKSITDEVKSGTGVKPLKVAHLKMMFFVEIIGLAIALLTFFCEIAVTQRLSLKILASSAASRYIGIRWKRWIISFNDLFHSFSKKDDRVILKEYTNHLGNLTFNTNEFRMKDAVVFRDV